MDMVYILYHLCTLRANYILNLKGLLFFRKVPPGKFISKWTQPLHFVWDCDL